MVSHSDTLKFRDSVMAWINQRVGELVPGPKYGTVQSLANLNAGVVSVLYNGETNPVDVFVGTIVPANTGVVVKVDGPNNNRQIVDVVQNYAANLYAYGVQGYGSSYRDNSTGTGYMIANDTDKWQSTSWTGTMNGAASTVLGIDYRITFDRWVDLRFNLTFNNVPTAGFLNFGGVLPTAVLNFASPGGIPVYGSYAGPTASAPGIIRISPSNQALWSAVPASKQNYSGSAAYSLDKPTF